MRHYIKSILVILLLTSCSTQPGSMIVGSWIEPIPGTSTNEVQGFTLGSDGKASSINMYTLVYKEWKMIDKHSIVLEGESIGNGQTIEFSDTLKIEKIDSDSLVLRNNDFYMRYVRKQ